MIKPKLASSSDSCFSLTAIPLETPAADVGVDSNQVLMYPLPLINILPRAVAQICILRCRNSMVSVCRCVLLLPWPPTASDEAACSLSISMPDVHVREGKDACDIHKSFVDPCDPTRVAPADSRRFTLNANELLPLSDPNEARLDLVAPNVLGRGSGLDSGLSLAPGRAATYVCVCSRTCACVYA